MSFLFFRVILSEKVQQGGSYVRSLFRSFMIPLVLGVLFGAIPLGLVSNWAAEMRAAGGKPISFVPYGWSEEDIASNDAPSYLTFFAVRNGLLYLLSWASYAATILFWRGGKGCLYVFPLIFGVVFLVCSIARIYMYSSGTLERSVVTEVALLYTQYLWSIVMSIVALVIAAPVGKRCQALWPFTKIIASQIFCFFVVQRTMIYIMASSFTFGRTLALVVLASVRGITMHVSTNSSLEMVGSNAEVALFINVMVMAMSSAGISMLQISNADTGWAATLVLYVSLYFSEVLKNRDLLRGTTEVDALKRRLATLVSLVSASCERGRQQFTPVVPMTNSEPVEDNPQGSSSEKKALLMQTVSASNGLELVSLFSAAVLYLVARVNPGEQGGEPFHWSAVLRNLALGLVTELLSDFSTAVFVPGELVELNNTLSQRSWPMAIAMNGVLIASTLEAFTHMIMYMCPWTVEDSTVFKSISLCPSA